MSAQRLSDQLTSKVVQKSITTFNSANSLIASGKSEPAVVNACTKIRDHGTCCSYRAQLGPTTAADVRMDGILGKCGASVAHPTGILQVLAVRRDRAKSLSQVLPRHHADSLQSCDTALMGGMVRKPPLGPPSDKYRGDSRGPRRRRNENG